MNYKLAIEKRLSEIFAAFCEGRDVPPAIRYRTEGFMLAGLESGGISESELMIIQRQVISAHLGEQSCDDIELGKIPSLMTRAPVTQTTKN